jgi:D-alanine-D-alanine ligase
MTLAITTDKPLSKQLLRAAGIATPDWWDTGSPPDDQQVIVKPSREDGSCGITAASVMAGTAATPLISSKPADAPDALFAEAYIDGREFNVSLLATAAEPEVLPVAEIRFVDFPEGRPKILDYEAKWAENSAAYRGTVRHTLSACEEQELTTQLSLIARKVWTLFDLRDYARVDFRVDAQGRPWVVDINANPCLAPDAGFTAAAAAAGLSFSEVIMRIVTAAQQRQRSAS